jgi:hypothetical protein
LISTKPDAVAKQNGKYMDMFLIDTMVCATSKQRHSDLFGLAERTVVLPALQREKTTAFSLKLKRQMSYKILHLPSSLAGAGGVAAGRSDSTYE